jgi:hypothetical protein
MTNGSLNSYRFNIWLPLFAALLTAIPLFIWFGFVFLAKVTGLVILVLLIYAMRIWFRKARLQNQRLERVHLNANDLFTIQQLIPSWKTWPNEERQILVNQLGLFLAEVQFDSSLSHKSKLHAGIYIVGATLNGGYSNKQGWVCIDLNDNKIQLQIPSSISFLLQSFDVQVKSLSALQNDAAVNDLRISLAQAIS